MRGGAIRRAFCDLGTLSSLGIQMKGIVVRKGEYRTRAQRLINGEFQPHDLSTLLLFLREHSNGMETVRDVGHMLGHSDARTKGVSLERVNDHYEIASFHMPRFAKGADRDLNLHDAPPRMLEAFDATFRLLGDDVLMRETGLTRAQASTRLTRIRRKFVRKSDGRLEWGRPEMHRKELALIQCLNSVIISQPAYSGEDFFNEFVSLLKRHGFMDDGQEDQLARRKPLIVLFAIAAMHGVRYIMPDGNQVEAEAGWVSGFGGALLWVSGKMRVTGLDIDLGFPIFETDLRAADWCEDYDPARRHMSWLVPIELTSQGRIRTIE